MSKKGGKQKKTVSSKPKSKWTPDLVMSGEPSATDESILNKLGAKLGVTDDGPLPQAFVDDGLDCLLNLPRYEDRRKGPIESDDDNIDEAPILVDSKLHKKEKKTKQKETRSAKVPEAEPAKKKKKRVPEPEEEEESDIEEEEEEEEEEIEDPKAVLEALKQQKAAKSRNRPKDEIDDVFAKLSDKKSKKKKSSKKVAAAIGTKSRPEDDGFAGRTLKPAGARKYTEEGFPIYTMDELGLNGNAGGDTPDCPFDCKCCV